MIAHLLHLKRNSKPAAWLTGRFALPLHKSGKVGRGLKPRRQISGRHGIKTVPYQASSLNKFGAQFFHQPLVQASGMNNALSVVSWALSVDKNLQKPILRAKARSC